MIKYLAAAALTAVLLSGCAAGSAERRVYTINATGYAQIEDGGAKKAKANALYFAKQNLLNNVASFLEYKFHFDPEMQQEIMYLSRHGGEGVHKDFYFVSLSYDLDLYKFVAKHGDFRDIYSWELLGLEGYYSDYISSNRPIGIWAKDEMFKVKKLDSTILYASSALPVFSGHFFLNKPIMAGFFTASKVLCLSAAVFSEAHETEIQTVSLVGLAVMTGLDMLSVFFEADALDKRLQFLQDAILTKTDRINAPVLNRKF